MAVLPEVFGKFKHVVLRTTDVGIEKTG